MGGGPSDAAHIFCDESGGSDAASPAFLVAAVAITPAEAQRLIKSFRRATDITYEVKGHRLRSQQRSIFFDLLTKRPGVVAAVVACSRLHPRGGWARGSMPEADIYSHLLAEACVAIPGLAIAGHLTVTPDRIRYKKAFADPIRKHVERAVVARHPLAKVSIRFEDSAALPGLQVADVIANSVFQSFGTIGAAEASRRLLAPLIAQGQLTIDEVKLQGVCPKWLDEV